MTLKSLLNHVGVDTPNGVGVQKRTRIFYDCEFKDNGRTIDLISIGMVADDGPEYYAVNADCDWEAVWNDPNPWLMENVAPNIPTILEMSQLDLYHPLVKQKDTIAREVRDFILQYEKPQLWAWYSSYDHVAYAQLFGRMIEIPEGLPKYTNDLKQECDRLGNPRLPEQLPGNYTALADARHNKVVAHFLDNLALSQDGRLW